MDQFAEEHTELRRLETLDSHTSGYAHGGEVSEAPKEGVYRFVAYASPYLFWATVLGLSAGILLI
ncbi:MAG: hypothetical protein GKR90_19120 [Pseudomonadales bacterium]|nr:hypothetical protein [Pseudomonadales bacterium]